MVTFLSERGFDVRQTSRYDGDFPDILLADTVLWNLRDTPDEPGVPTVFLVAPDQQTQNLPVLVSNPYGYASKRRDDYPLLLATVNAMLGQVVRDKERHRESETHRFLFENMPVAAIVCDPDYIIQHWNRGARELFGYTAEEAVGRDMTQLLYSTRNEQSRENLKRSLLNSLTINQKSQNVNYDRTKDGWDLLCEWYDLPYRDDERNYILSVATDITHKRALIQTLRSTIDQKDILMREIYHRLKNNLHMIESLIRLKIDEVEQPDRSRTESAAVVLKDIEQKIAAFSVLYEMLHQRGLHTGELNVNAADYLEELLTTVFSSMSATPPDTAFRFEDVSVKPQTAVVLGLITNEIATNALKHSMPSDGKFRFSASLRIETDDTGSQMCVYVLENTGKPFPHDVNVETSRSLGLRLIFSLGEQLKGSVSLRKEPSPQYTIRFPLAPLA